MFFLHPWFLLAAGGVLAPIFLHLLNRRRSSRRPWGAMMFLAATLAQRRRRILAEEFLLLATRCLIVALAAVAFARPCAAAGEGAAWVATAAVALAALLLGAAAAASWSNRRVRVRALVAAVALAAFAAVSASVDGVRAYLGAVRAGARDVAIVLDASSSMAVAGADGRSAFDRARKEIDNFIQSSPRNTAFALILGGTQPQALTASPVTDRRLLFQLLDEARPLEGTFQAPDAVALAAAVLAQGSQSTKQVVVFGDGQAAGWRFGDDETWAYVSDALGRLPGTPRVIWRTLGLPERLRNLTVADLRLSRTAIGTDRDVRVDVTVANNGDEAATPDALLLSAEGRTYSDSAVGQLQPGQRRTVSFRHRFRSPGTHAVKAILDVSDDLPSDNALTRVAAVRSGMRVLVVEGARGRRLADQPGVFVALALSPASVAKDAEKGAGGGKTPAPPPAAPSFVAPTRVAAADLGSVESLSDYAAVVLADVPRLGTNDAVRLRDYVEAGGGLLAVCGPRARPDFYNGWTDSDGAPLLPLALVGDAPRKSDGVPLDPKSIAHPALAALAADGDLGSAVFEQRWTTDPAPSARVGASLASGDALFADHRAGKGRVLQFAAALDPASGNLVSRQGFLPMVHELVYYIARPVVPDLNLQPAVGAALTLDGAGETGGAHGLRGVYRSGDADGPLLRVSLDRTLQLDWRQRPLDPALPNNAPVHVEWTGSLTVPVPGVYTVTAQSGGRAVVSFPEDRRHLGLRRSSATVDLEAGRRHDLVVTYDGKNRDGSFLMLRWRGPGIPGEQTIPEAFLSPRRATDRAWSETYPVAVESAGGPLPATLRVSRDAVALAIPRRLAPGTYAAAVPAALAPSLNDLGPLSNGFARVAFCVATDASESVLAPATPDDIAFAARHADFVAASTPDELARAIGGAKVGRELWRRAAAPLFILLVLEIFLTRWISGQRRLGEEGRVSFDEGTQVSSRFAEILREMTGSV